MTAHILDLHAVQLLRACEAIEQVHVLRKDGALVLCLSAARSLPPFAFERCAATLCVKTGEMQRNVPVQLVRRSENEFEIRFWEERRLVFEVFRANGCSSNIETVNLVAGLFYISFPNAGYEYRISMGS